MTKSNKLKILIITDTRVAALGGSEKHIRFLLNTFPQRGIELYVAELQGKNRTGTSPDSPLNEIWPGVCFIALDVKRIYGLGALQAFYTLSRLINRNSIDIVLSFHEKSDILNALLVRVGGSSMARVSSRRDMFICPSPLLLRLRKMLSHRYTMITAPCRPILDMVARVEKIPEAKLRLLYNSVDVDLFRPAREGRDQGEISMPHTGLRGVCVGNLKAVKGHKYLLDAFAILVQSFPDSELLLVGEDQGIKAAIQDQIERLCLTNHVRLLGGRSDIAAILQSCDYMVCSSLSEGLSNALLEGISCALPVIATDVGGNSEIVDEGENGFLCPPEDSAHLAERLLTLSWSTDTEIVRMAGRSREIACSRFSMENIIASYMDFLCDIRY